MRGFAQFYLEFLDQLWNNIIEGFEIFGSLFSKAFYKDWVDNGYINSFTNAIGTWNALDYVAFIVVLIINFGFIFLLVTLIVQLVKRYIHFNKRELDKDVLVEEVSLLNQKVVELIDEKNKILAMRVSQIGVGAPGLAAEATSAGGLKKSENESRFSKLIEVDKLALENPQVTVMNSSDMIDLPELINRFINVGVKVFYKRKDALNLIENL